MAVDYRDRPVTYPSTASVVHDGTALLVAIRNHVDAKKPIRATENWGQDDAVEVALQDVSGDRPGHVYVLRGFPNETWVSSQTAGAPAADAKRVRNAADYAARTVRNGVWECEWRIPLGALGVPPPRPAAEPSLRFNVTAYKSCAREWAMWRASHGQLPRGKYRRCPARSSRRGLSGVPPTGPHPPPAFRMSNQCRR